MASSNRLYRWLIKVQKKPAFGCFPAYPYVDDRNCMASQTLSSADGVQKQSRDISIVLAICIPKVQCLYFIRPATRVFRPRSNSKSGTSPMWGTTWKDDWRCAPLLNFPSQVWSLDPTLYVQLRLCCPKSINQQPHPSQVKNSRNYLKTNKIQTSNRSVY
jgi:hypothetical protein